MKSKKSLVFGSILIFGSIVGCSSMVESTRKSLLGDSSDRKTNNKESKWVSRAQYDDLLSKYKDLNKKYENLKDNKINTGAGLDELDSIVASTETIDINDSVPAVKEKSIESEIDYYFKAATLLENNKLDEALKVYQFLEKSNAKQIRVRAKSNIGNIYLTKKQYDLALQVFEGIIQNDSYSSYVVDALRKASFCSNKLGLVSKKDKYESLLKDVFEVRS